MLSSFTCLFLLSRVACCGVVPSFFTLFWTTSVLPSFTRLCFVGPLSDRFLPSFYLVSVHISTCYRVVHCSRRGELCYQLWKKWSIFTEIYWVYRVLYLIDLVIYCLFHFSHLTYLIRRYPVVPIYRVFFIDFFPIFTLSETRQVIPIKILTRTVHLLSFVYQVVAVYLFSAKFGIYRVFQACFPFV